MPAIRDLNRLMRDYLWTRYSTTNPDLQTLIRRYVRENPNSRTDETKIMKDLEAAASA